MKRAIQVLGAIMVALPSLAVAQDLADVTERRSVPIEAAGAGETSPLLLSATRGSQRALVLTGAGYDAARRGALFESAAEVGLWGPIALRAGATYSDDTRRMRPSLGVRVQLSRQTGLGLDTSVGSAYKAEGFNEAEGEIETTLAIGRRFGHLYVLGNLAYGQDPEGNERDAEVRAAALETSGRVVWGVETRGRRAIGPQHGASSAREAKADAIAAAVAMLAVGDFVLFADVGPSAVQPQGSGWSIGVASILGGCALF